MKKGILILVLVCLVAVAGCKKKEADTSSQKFGEATIVLLDTGKYELACNDAKSLSAMIKSINADFAANPNLGELSPDNMTPAMRDFEATMDNFSKSLESKFKDNETLLEEVVAGIGDGVSNVFQLSIMSHLGMVTPENVQEFIDVTYCGVAPKAGYVSPLEAPMTPENMPSGDKPEAPLEPKAPVKK